MSIQKRTRKDGSVAYLVRITAADGSSKQINVGTYGTLKEAKHEEREALYKRDHGGKIDIGKFTIGEMMDAWLASHASSLSSQSRVDYEATIRLHIKPKLGRTRVTAFTASRARLVYQEWEEGGKSPDVIQKCHQRLKQAFAQAVDDRTIPANPLANVKPPRSTKKTMLTLDRLEVRAFLDAARKSGYHPLWHLLILEGMRRGEALGLRWSDIHWGPDSTTVHIQQQVSADKENGGRAVVLPYTKTKGSARTVLLSPETEAELKKLREDLGSLATGHQLVLTTTTRAPINPANIDRAMMPILKAAGITKDIRVHDLRHTCATLLLQARMPVKAVSERLGHQNTRITLDLYSHVMPDMQQDTANAWKSILPPSTTTPNPE